MWIAGQEAAASSDRSFEVRNPATGETVAKAAEGSAQDADRAVEAARKAFEGPWSRLGPGERARFLYKIARDVREAAERLAVLQTQETGKPIRDSRDEVWGAANCFEYYAGAVTKHSGETIPVTAKGLDFTLRQPIGVCALIVPWNYPLAILSWKLAPALACGNTVVIKPASYTPLTALELAKICEKAGAPPGVVNVVTGPGSEVGSALASHPAVGKVSFTGETATGAEIMKLAAPTIKRVSLELGGKSPNIVFEDCDLDLCVEKSVFSVFSNAGQDCCARSRAIVERSILERFVEGFVRRTRALRVGDPMDPKTEMGPLQSSQQRERVLGYLSTGKQEGARLVCGGETPKDPGRAKGWYLLPAVLDGVKPSMRVFQEEIFGPVLCVTPFETEEEAVQLANATEYGLSGSIWTRDIGRALRVAREVQSGVLSVNSASSVHLEAPFGGFKRSGLGRELGFQALDAYSEVKNVFVSTEP